MNYVATQFNLILKKIKMKSTNNNYFTTLIKGEKILFLTKISTKEFQNSK